MAKTPKTYRIPELGLEIMTNSVKDEGGWHELRSKLENEADERKLASQIEKMFPGEGWRLPTLPELKLMGKLAELGLDINLATQDHYNYYQPIISSDELDTKIRGKAKACLRCVRTPSAVSPDNPDGVYCVIITQNGSGIGAYPPLVRLVRDI